MHMCVLNTSLEWVAILEGIGSCTCRVQVTAERSFIPKQRMNACFLEYAACEECAARAGQADQKCCLANFRIADNSPGTAQSALSDIPQVEEFESRRG